MEIKLIKQRIEAPSQKLNVKWTFELEEPEEVRKKPETEEEEADEIIRRLKAPPRKNRLNAIHGLDLEKEIMEVLSKSIAEEIDKEIIYGQRTNITR